MKKVILVILDGLCAQTAFKSMGFMESLVEHGIASRYTVKSEMPAMSRPLYEVLMTGVPVYEHGIFTNEVRRPSKERNLFLIAKENGLVTAAAAYHWFSELYNKSPFNPLTDRFALDTDLPIEHGIFYYEDMYPDTHLFNDAEFLRENYEPDFLVVHSMNIDFAGHREGLSSNLYAQAAVRADAILAMCIKNWLACGYTVAVTADHGMSDTRMHNGNTDCERLVPLYVAGVKTSAVLPQTGFIPQLDIAPFICELLGLPKSEKMNKNPAVRLQKE